MEERDLQEVARHMGHELAVHRKFYRLQDDIIELAKISKLLIAVENGKAAQYSGISLDDLDLNGICLILILPCKHSCGINYFLTSYWNGFRL